MTTVDRWLFVLKLLAALGGGLMAGVFFAFSSFVMGALAQLPPAQGMAAMQLINIRVLNPLWLGAFMGAALACALVAISSLLKLHAPGAALALAGALLYLVDTFGVTAAFNVPLNDALAAANPGNPGGAKMWASYLATWTMWNHARTIAALLAAALLTLGLCQRAPDVGITPSPKRPQPPSATPPHRRT